MPDLNSPLQDPKKARLIIICLLTALATLGAVTVYIACTFRPASDSPPEPSPTLSEAPAESESLAPVGLVPALTIDEARALALADAGVAEEDADVSREALAQDNGVWVYEFRFRAADAQYEYKLNANSGDVRGKVKESFAYPSPEPAESAAPDPAPSPTARPVQTSQPAPQPTPTPQPPATDPPAPSPEPVPTAAPSQPAPVYIGMDRAKAIALGHAGLSADQVRFTQAQMDREDGRMVYEIEFRQGQVEYEYEIDATTGQILDWDRDLD